MQNNPNFKIIYDKIIVGKSNSKSDAFDVIHFALKDIGNAFVPSYITSIASHAFQNCKFLKSVEFDNVSNLDSFGLCSLCETSIESIKIHKNVTRIEQETFSSCRKLTNVEFDDQSELRFIEYYAFSSTNSIYRNSSKAYCHSIICNFIL
ncbi:hypothetical protein M9Y10_021306 [Tritrichomonas musculus]|uniref:Surface antigen BspA-like n=1 Tax=Tritrichomonas musculus TaxID=1915356 RepID=A0ABR2HDK4_9EUKA